MAPAESHCRCRQGPALPCAHTRSTGTPAGRASEDRATSTSRSHHVSPAAPPLTASPAPHASSAPQGTAPARIRTQRRFPEARGASSKHRGGLYFRPGLCRVSTTTGGRAQEEPEAAGPERRRQTLGRPREGRRIAACASLSFASALAGTTFPRERCGGRLRPLPAAVGGRGSCGRPGRGARRPQGRGEGRGGARWTPGVPAVGGGSERARLYDMQGAASAGARGRGSPPRRGSPRTKPGSGRGRTAGTPAAFARPARGRLRARNGLSCRGPRAAVTMGPENRGEGDRWSGTESPPQSVGRLRSGAEASRAHVLLNGGPSALGLVYGGIIPRRYGSLP